MAPERIQRRPPDPRGTLEDQGRADGDPGGLYFADPPQGRNTQETLGDVPRGFALGTVGLHRARALRLCRGHGHRLVCRQFLQRDGQDRRAFPRVDDRRRRTPPAQTRPLCGHALHDARHGHGALHRRQRPAALQRPGQVQCRRTGPAVQRRGQALDREDGRHVPRRLPHGQRHHGQRMQIPAGA